MHIISAIIDHNAADLAERELFACDRDQEEALYRAAREEPGIEGAVLLNTCNRTELYFSLQDGEAGKERDPFAFLCACLGLDADRYEHLVKREQDDAALSHLCLLTAGAKSQLRGDSQIISQVAGALERARDQGATDSVLNTAFRLGITAGKQIRSNMNLRLQDDSTVDRAIGLIAEQEGIRRVLVIGNGVIGRLAAEGLARRGYQVLMTLRQYHNREAIIPPGVSVVAYDDRYKAIASCDAVVSATASPHLVVCKEDLARVLGGPLLLLDLAVPRDIDPRVSELADVTCYNIDQISSGHQQEVKNAQMEKLQEYVTDYTGQMHRWSDQRMKKEADLVRLTAPGRDRSERRYFPLYIDSLDRLAVVVGGGNIAERRVMTLAEFGFRIRVVSGSLTDTLKRMAEGGAISWVRKWVAFSDEARPVNDSRDSNDGQDISGLHCSMEEAAEDAWMVLACTNKRELNRQIGNWGKDRDLLVNICDNRRESTFWFPAVALSDELTMGLVGTGADHSNVKKAAARLRQVVEDKEYK